MVVVESRTTERPSVSERRPGYDGASASVGAFLRCAAEKVLATEQVSGVPQAARLSRRGTHLTRPARQRGRPERPIGLACAGESQEAGQRNTVPQPSPSLTHRVGTPSEPISHFETRSQPESLGPTFILLTPRRPRSPFAPAGEHCLDSAASCPPSQNSIKLGFCLVSSCTKLQTA